MENRSFGGYSTRSLGGGGSQGFWGWANSGPARIQSQTVAPIQATSQIQISAPVVETKGFQNREALIESCIPAAKKILPNGNPEKIAEVARVIAEQQISNLEGQRKWDRFFAVWAPLAEHIEIRNIWIRIKSKQEVEISNGHISLMRTNYQEMQMENTVSKKPSKDWITLCKLADWVEIRPDGDISWGIRKDISRLENRLQEFFGRNETFISLTKSWEYHSEFRLTKDKEEV